MDLQTPQEVYNKRMEAIAPGLVRGDCSTIAKILGLNRGYVYRTLYQRSLVTSKSISVLLEAEKVVAERKTLLNISLVQNK